MGQSPFRRLFFIVPIIFVTARLAQPLFFDSSPLTFVALFASLLFLYFCFDYFRPRNFDKNHPKKQNDKPREVKKKEKTKFISESKVLAKKEKEKKKLLETYLASQAEKEKNRLKPAKKKKIQISTTTALKIDNSPQEICESVPTILDIKDSLNKVKCTTQELCNLRDLIGEMAYNLRMAEIHRDLDVEVWKIIINYLIEVDEEKENDVELFKIGCLQRVVAEKQEIDSS